MNGLEHVNAKKTSVKDVGIIKVVNEVKDFLSLGVNIF